MPDLKRHSFQVISGALADAIAAMRVQVRTARNPVEAEQRATAAILAAVSPIASELAKANAGFDRDRFLAPIAAAAGELSTTTNVIEGDAKKS
jgi:hypothetical protein